MEANQEADQTLVNKYETVFCVFMAVLAYLWRDNPNIAIKDDFQSIRRILMRCKGLVADFAVSVKLSDPPLNRSSDFPIEVTRSTSHQIGMKGPRRTV